MEDINVLKQALPYIRRFKGATFVIKLGGEAMSTREALERVIDDVSLLYLVGIRVVLVHGGGVHVTRVAEQLGVETRFVGGRRITDEQTLDVLKMVIAGKISVEILSTLKKKAIPAMGVSGVAAGVIEARRRPPTKVTGSDDQVIDFGEVGDIERIDTHLISLLLDNGYVPVLSPLGADADGNVLNINADTVACRLAASLQAEKLLLMTGTLGVMGDMSDPTTLISRLTAEEARQAIADGIIRGGMIPKIEEALRAIDRGAGQVHILSAVEPHQILLEVFTPSGCGTMLVAG
ncbi:MAG: acetylglutamate kinase [Myxococcales bacterium]|nr:acetylglutamate kinase [Myxococcales bacterium]MCB9521690.1 acetylglutamate kinase [Myxococcales bacterium]MCB9531906.1 acetylglutamate kinase [Myxococcales bacterium]MCB9533874.1 acetylglutamate kinase [Myxococcales bacterium]